MELTLYRGPRGLLYGADTIQRAQGPCVWSGHYIEGPGAFCMEGTLYRGPKQRVSLVASIHTTGEGFAI